LIRLFSKSLIWVAVFLLAGLTPRLAVANCDSLYKAALYPPKKSDKIKDEVGEGISATGTGLTVANVAISGLDGTSGIAGFAGPAAAAMPVYVLLDGLLSRNRTHIDVARWILKQSHGARSIHETHNDYEDNFDSPSAYANVFGHWDLHDLSKKVLKNKEIQQLHPSLSQSEVESKVAQLDDGNAFCKVRLSEQEDILLIVLASYGAADSVRDMTTKLEKREISRKKDPALISQEIQAALQ
jgi:hypothetical protein